MEDPDIGPAGRDTVKKPVYSTLGWRCTCFFFVLLAAVVLPSCSRKKAAAAHFDADSLSCTSVTRDVVTFISDSGVTKYKLVTDIWITRDEPEEQWVFPEGLYLEQFDTLFHRQASVVADTAYYHVSLKLWELKDNIRVTNREGTQFFGNHLFWDEGNELVYSHDSIRILRGEGEELRSRFGFKSNQYMTKYELYSTAGHIDVDESGEAAAAAPADTLVRSDSVAALRPRDSLLHVRPLRSNPYRKTE